MTHIAVGSHHHWLTAVESVLGHVLAVVIGFVMMIVGLALGVTMIMLPVGIVVSLTGAALFVGGLFAHIGRDA